MEFCLRMASKFLSTFVADQAPSLLAWLELRALFLIIILGLSLYLLQRFVLIRFEPFQSTLD